MMRLALPIILLHVFLAGCSRGWNKTLPSSSELGSPRGYRIVRTIMHMHSPISWDACDMKGSATLSANPKCLSHVRDAFCLNRIDYAFMTDHPNFMSEAQFSDLLLLETSKGDTAIESLGSPIANQMACTTPTDHLPVVMAGYEDRLMGMGMSKHYGTTQEDRSVYLGESAADVTNVRADTGAVMAVPHIESRDLSLLESLGVDALEIYNFHSNLDPKIRSQYLERPSTQYLFDLLNYWLDPYYRQEADLSLFSFFEVSDVILAKWHQSWSNGHTMTGFAASDSHENVLSMSAPDGDRLDSHRRLLRWVSNHFLVSTPTIENVKAAIRAGRGWFVVEGLGSPVGFDFQAQSTVGDVVTTVGVGEMLKIRGLTATVRVDMPTLHPRSPGAGVSVQRRMVLKKISGATATVVAESIDTPLVASISEPGIYRAEVLMVPSHLKNYLYFDAVKAEQEMLWIFTNPIRLADEDP